jgi:2-polyprenyl-3-methyl-5-hydroxy-6-metoxy-1,4-benzoquinol methylase
VLVWCPTKFGTAQTSTQRASRVRAAGGKIPSDMTRDKRSRAAPVVPTVDEMAHVGGLTLEGFARAPRINEWVYGKLRHGIEGDVLEIGSGTGNLSRLILGDARRLVLTDVEPRYLDTLQRDLAIRDHVEVVSWNLTEPPPAILSGGGRQFDTVVAVNVIEHLRDDSGAVRALAGLLKPGGSLLMYVPACSWAFGSLDVALGHHRRYTRTSLRALLREAGLDDPRPRYMNRLGLVGWLVNGRLLRRRVLSLRMIALFDRIVGVARAVDFLLAPFPWGLGLVARARKIPPSA